VYMGVLMRRQKKIYFFIGWPFCKGPSRRAGVVLKKTRIYQMILKNIWLFPILSVRSKILLTSKVL